jgi:hypothetical protein
MTREELTARLRHRTRPYPPNPTYTYSDPDAGAAADMLDQQAARIADLEAKVKSAMMPTIEQRYEELAEIAQSQCEDIIQAIQIARDPDRPDDNPERLQGITRTQPPLDRAALVFHNDSANLAQTLVYVDAILDLAALLNRERVLLQPEADP